MTAHASPAAPAEKRGCLGRAVGCFGIAGALLVAALALVVILPVWRIGVIRDTIAPDMAPEVVVERARGWLVCRAFAGPPDKPTVEFHVNTTSYGASSSSTGRTFSTSAEMARALAADMKPYGIAWTMTFGYTTNGPKRMYFDVEFSPDGRVKRISETRWGRLD
jgi:hypothetical protein